MELHGNAALSWNGRRRLAERVIGVPRFGGHLSAWSAFVRLGGKDAPPCQGDRTFTSRTRRSFGVKLLSWSGGRAGS